jgi:hypothetical protein
MSLATVKDYRDTKPAGKCNACTINLWAEHGDKPAPNAMPCPMANCPHKTSAKLLSFPKSSVGSSLAMITGN